MLRSIPAGAFEMGGDNKDKFSNDTERPRHTVHFRRPFLLSDFPITVGGFRCFIPDHAPLDAAELPATSITWVEAVAYCEWLSHETGRSFRLPSEAEWEYACRAGTQTPFSTGGDIAPTEACYLYSESGERIGAGTRSPRGSHPANAWGLESMHGNVCEWCADVWHPNHFGAPTDGSPHSDSTNPRRVIRGGAWDYLPRLLRSSWRDSLPADARRDNVGFRVACDIA